MTATPRHRERGQAFVLLVAALLALALGVGALGALGRALLGKGRMQRAADLAAVSAARSMRDDFPRLFEPPVDRAGRPNSRHLEKDRYLERAQRTAVEVARLNGASLIRSDVDFPDHTSFAPVRVRVQMRGMLETGGSRRARDRVAASATAEAQFGLPAQPGNTTMEGGGYQGPFAYRQGKPMRPDVARAFDRMQSEARGDGIQLVIASAYRSDAEQAQLYARHPDPRWVAPPGTSLHRLGTELDLGPPSADRWLAANAGSFHFLQRYSWEPWHYGYTLNPRSTPDHLRGAGRPGDGETAMPSFVPAGFRPQIAHAASRWNVSASLLAAQLYVESNFNPFAVSPAGARGIAQFMPGTAQSYGLDDPFDAAAAINAQAHLMRDLLRRFGSVALALAGYNAGSGAVDRCACVPPFIETQAYVARVLALMGGAGETTGAASTLEVRLVS